jgi:TolB-like protein/cytochrome c-type biogenesis protein CcmH/NrfG
MKSQLGPYRILSQLGAGGMGEVYRALDTRLDRQVALKILPAIFAHDPERVARFEREAKAVAALSHPNILAIHDCGHDAGVWFVVMELLEGETLRQRLAHGPLALRKALEIGSAAAEALAAAHDRGIIHRDLKPENLFLTREGRLKLLDFGLARIQPHSQVDAMTEEYVPAPTRSGVVMGTAGYMSPEQVRGLSADARSDIFALGCVLYEMLSGRRAFQRDTEAETMTAILHDDPAPLSKRNIPLVVERQVRHCLEKNPQERLQSARDLMFDLRRLAEAGEATEIAKKPMSGRRAWIMILIASVGLGVLLAGTLAYRRWAPTATGARAVTAAPEITSLAVLPFVNENQEPSMEYLSEGITDSLTNNLAELPRLRIIARTSAFRYKGRDVEPQEAGKALNVEAVLIGRMAERDGELHVSTELVGVSDNRHLWGGTFRQPQSDALRVQEEICQQLVLRLRPEISVDERARATRHHTDNPRAYQLYVQGRYFWSRRTPEDMKRAVECFQRAIREDPSYALAHVGLADTYIIEADFQITPTRQALPAAEVEAQAALAINPDLAEPHATLGYIKYVYLWDWSGGEAEFRRSIELKPAYGTARHWYSVMLAASGRWHEAHAQLASARDLDPLSLVIATNSGIQLFWQRHYDDAIKYLRNLLDSNPNFTAARFYLGRAYAQKHQFREAIAEFEAMEGVEGKTARSSAALASVYAQSGQRTKAEAILRDLTTGHGAPVSPCWIAIVCAALGDKKSGLQWLDKAHEVHDSFLVSMGIDPSFDSFRREPRFQKLLEQVGLAH